MKDKEMQTRLQERADRRAQPILIGTGEIFRDYGLSRVQVMRLRQAGDLPEPKAMLGKRAVWDAGEFEKQMQRLARCGRISRRSDGRPYMVSWGSLGSNSHARRKRAGA